jgi:hypothetical protein
MKSMCVVPAAFLLSALALPALAGPVIAKDGRFEADVSARQMSRIAVLGDKIESVRKIDDPNGPQILVETDAKTGDAFIGFDGDVAGRVFSVFLVTEGGRTLQAILHPIAAEGQTVLVKLDGAGATGSSPTTSTPIAGRPDRRETYTEVVTAFTRLMFNGDEVDGVSRKALYEPSRKAGPFMVRQVWSYDVSGLHGRVIYVTNVSQEAVPVTVDAFLVEGVIAAAASHETLRPGEQGRVFVVEEAGQ